ncbi:MAG: hypothetical protein ACPGH0_06260 [Opitutales bacterium]
MPTLLIWIGRIGLALTILPAVGFLFGVLTLSTTKLLMIVGMPLWFIAAPIIQHLKSSD